MQQAAPPRAPLRRKSKAMLPRSTGCMRVWGMGGRVVPSNSDGYSKLQQLSLLAGFPSHKSHEKRRCTARWHHDQPLPDDSGNPNYRTVKVFVSLWDLPVGGGATAGASPQPRAQGWL